MRTLDALLWWPGSLWAPGPPLDPWMLCSKGLAMC